MYTYIYIYIYMHMPDRRVPERAGLQPAFREGPRGGFPKGGGLLIRPFRGILRSNFAMSMFVFSVQLQQLSLKFPKK